jgi:hypothetical protein
MIASSVLMLGVALLAALSPSAAAARASHSLPSIDCPGAVGTSMCCPLPTATLIAAMRPAVAPCCPVPTSAGCCAQTTTCCATTPCPSPSPALTIAASPKSVSEGSHVTISGTLSGGTVAAQKVDLYERPAGQATFSDVASTQTGASGGYSFVRAVHTNAQWYATTGAVQSPTTALESVLAAVALHPSSARPKAGAKVTFTGTIAPSHAGERVQLQRLEHGQWVTIARPMLNSKSRFATAEKLRKHASARFRVVLAADTRNARSVSAVVAITAR